MTYSTLYLYNIININYPFKGVIEDRSPISRAMGRAQGIYELDAFRYLLYQADVYLPFLIPPTTS